MNKNQINKFRMLGAVDLVLSNYSVLFASMGDLVTAHQRLRDGIESVSAFRQVQEADNSGLTQVKVDLRARLFNRIMQFSAALMAHATSVKDTNLKTKANYSKTLLVRSSDPVLYDIGILLQGLANPLRNELIVYFVGDAEFADLENLLNDFKVAIPQKRVALNVSKVSTGNINSQFNVLDQLLKEEVDILMLPFQFTQPDFYNAYKNARIIVDYSGRGKTKTEEEVTES
jgi:hypothetical protein